MASVAALRARLESSLPERLSSTLLLRERAVPLTVSTGVAALDALTGGLPRGALSEISGTASSGRTAVMLAALAIATHRQEVCALVDASDSFDPASAVAAGVDLQRLLWVRCSKRTDTSRRKDEAPRTALGRLEPGPPANTGFAFGGVMEQVLKVTDLLLQGGGFGMVALDLGDIPPESARRVPLASWFRFRRAVEPTATVLLLVEQEPCAKTCASLVVRLECEAVCTRDSAPAYARGGSGVLARGGPEIPANNAVSHAALLRGVRLHVEVVRSSAPASVKSPQQTQSRRSAGTPGSTQRKSAQPAGINFELRAAW
jgi:recombination protein RecA